MKKNIGIMLAYILICHNCFSFFGYENKEGYDENIYSENIIIKLKISPQIKVGVKKSNTTIENSKINIEKLVEIRGRQAENVSVKLKNKYFEKYTLKISEKNIEKKWGESNKIVNLEIPKENIENLTKGKGTQISAIMIANCDSANW